jgi:hypothetical protein
LSNYEGIKKGGGGVERERTRKAERNKEGKEKIERGM